MGKKRILYIEDDDRQRREFTRLLRAKSFVVVPAGSGGAGLRLLKSRPLDVILCDLHMPGLSGLEVLKRAKKSHPTVPVIILTGHGTTAQAVRAVKQGAFHFGLKPLDIEDITTTIAQAIGHVELQRKLAESEAEMRRLVENAPDIIYSFDVRGRFISISPAAKAVLGYEPKEMIGRQVLTIIHPDDRERVKYGMIQSIKNKKPITKTLQFRMATKAGEIRHFEISRRMIIENGRVVRFDGIARDITEHKLLDEKLQEKARLLEYSTIELGMANIELLGAQETLEEKNTDMERLLAELSRSRDELQAILDSSASAIIMVDRKGIIQTANRRCTDYFRISPGDIIDRQFNKVIKEIRKLFGEKKKFDSTIARLKKQPDKPEAGEVSRIHERAIKLSGPTTRFLSIFCVPVLDNTGAELGRTWLFEDITKFKQADEQLRLLVEASPVPSIITRLHDGLIIYANDKLAELVGTTKRKLIEQVSPDFYYNPEVRKQVIGILQRDGILPNMEVRLKRIDGTPIWTIFSLALTELGGDQVILGSLYDITKRKEAEEKLAEAQALLSAAIEQSPAGIVVADAPDGDIRIANATALAIRGQTPARLTDITVDDHSVNWQTFYPDGRPCDGQELPLSRAITHGEVSRDVELIIRRESGEDRWVNVNASPIRNQEGKITAGIVLFNDITERKQAERALKKAHTEVAERLRYEEGLAGCSRALLTVADPGAALNKAICYLLDASRASRVYIFENFEDETDGLCMRQTHEVCAEGITPQIDDELLQHAPYKLGFERWRQELSKGNPIEGLVESYPQSEQDVLLEQGNLSMLVLPIFVEKQWFGFIGFDECCDRREWSAEDIRSLRIAAEMIGVYLERRRVAEALRVSEERFRSLVENARDVIYSLSPNGVFTYLSPQFTASTGYDPAAYIGKSHRLLIHDHDHDKAEHSFEQAMAEGKTDVGVEYRIQHKEGSWRWFESHSSVVHDEEGNISEIIGIAHDITEMKKAYDDLQEAQTQLVQSAKMASLGTLVAGVAHEINTPIGAVRSMHDTLVRAVGKLKNALAEQLPEGWEEKSQLSMFLEMVDEANRVIESGTKRVAEIVKRLRSFARLDEAELKTVDIHEGLEDTLSLVHHEIKHNIEVIRNYGDVPEISVYPGRLNQVFLNILNNARQAIKGKGTITFTTGVKDNRAYVAIADSGIGIPADKVKRVFDPGFTTKGVGVGTGLGLSICYQIMQDHHGRIDVESEIGHGTTFTIWLSMDLDTEIGNNRKDRDDKSSAT